MIHVVTPFHNAAPYLRGCLDSLLRQDVQEWQCWLYDDASTDGSVETIRPTLVDSRFHLTTNPSQRGLTWNYSCFRQNAQVQDEDLVISLDGDDQLAGNQALRTVCTFYREFPQLWLTWGSYLCVDARGRTRPGISRSVADVTLVRNKPWRTSHLRTCKAFLLRAIREEDLLDQQGNYYSPAGDMALMFPMLEMATNQHALHIPSYLYYYHEDNPHSDHRLHGAEQRANERWLRSRPPYQPYASADVDHHSRI